MTVELSGVAVGYGKKEILRDVNLAITPGKPVIITGQTGAGKTSLLLTVALVHKALAGSIKIDGAEALRFSSGQRRLYQRRAGVQLQEGIASGITTVGHFLHLVLLGKKLPSGSVSALAMQALDTLGIAHLHNARLADLSGGQRQLVSIAVMIAHNPDLIIADEPVAHLDRDATLRVAAVLADFARKGASVLLSTHTGDLAHSFSSALLCEVKGGKLSII